MRDSVEDCLSSKFVGDCHVLIVGTLTIQETSGKQQKNLENIIVVNNSHMAVLAITSQISASREISNLEDLEIFPGIEIISINTVMGLLILQAIS